MLYRCVHLSLRLSLSLRYSLFVFEVVFIFGVSVALKIPLYRLSYMSYVCLRYACLYACLMYMSV